ncbi:MAG: TolC family protein [Bacteroidetes bacterium]|nr:TolC family protein [Bacteroidota bacterium]
MRPNPWNVRMSRQMWIVAGLLSIQMAMAQNMPLTEALDRAIEGNPSLQAVQAQREAADLRVWETRGAHLPQISLNAAYSWSEKPLIVLPIHQQGVFPPLDDRIFESNVQVSVPIFTGGKTITRTRAAEAGARQAEANSDAARMDLLQQILLIYIGTAEIDDGRTLLSARLSDLRKRRDELLAQLDEGRTAPAQPALLQSHIEILRADSINLQQNASDLAWRLGRLLGLDAPIEAEVTSLEFSTPELRKELSGERSTERNSEWQRAHATMLQAEAEAAFATASFYPDVSGFALYNYRSGGSAWDPAGEWIAGFRLSLPLLEGGRRIVSLSASRATLRAAEQQLKATEQWVHSEREIAREQWSSAYSRMGHSRQAYRQKAEFVEAQRTLHASGRIPLSELMTQETELLHLALQERGQKYESLRAATQYYRITGMLTRDVLLTIAGEKNQ